MTTTTKMEEKAVKTGVLDGFLVALFAGLAYLGIELLSWAATNLDLLDTFHGGDYAWVKIPLALLITSVLKGLDRKKHEDPSPSTGLVKLPD
jgi:hypothetical protein